jgi:hypothetical protein
MTLRKTKKGGKKCGFFNKMFKSKHCKHHHHKGGAAEFTFSNQDGGSSSSQGLTNWLWGVSDVSKHNNPPPPSHPPAPSTDTNNDQKNNKPHKGGRKSNKRRTRKGGLSSQLVPIGLLAGVLASRKKRRYRKRSKSKTRKGRLDFVTHKGDKFYNRNNKRQSFNQVGIKGRPF